MADKQSDALVAVKLRYEFYRDGYRRLVSLFLLMLVLNVSIIWGVFQVISTKPQSQFFATTSDGQIVALHPLTQPVFSTAQVLTWATETAMNAYSYDYVNYRQQISNVQKSFTSNGWQSFLDALNSSLMLKTVINQKLVMSAEPTGAPQVKNKGEVDGKYSWVIEIPMLVKMQGATTMPPTPVKVTLMVQRVSIENNPKGIGIVNYIASEGL